MRLVLGDGGWRYETVLINLDRPPEDAWRSYHQRRQPEYPFKERKEGHGIDEFSTGSAGANDADLGVKGFSNLLCSFRHSMSVSVGVLPPSGGRRSGCCTSPACWNATPGS